MIETPPPAKTTLGLEQNIEALLCYVLGWLTGIVFIILEKENRFVRFHAMQSILVFLPLTAASFVIGLFPIIGWLIALLLNIVIVVAWLFLMYQAVTGKMFKAPIVGDIAEAQTKG